MMNMYEPSYSSHMNRKVWEDVVSSPTFTKPPKISQLIILAQMSAPVSSEAVVSQAERPKVVSMEVTPPMPTAPRSPQLKKSDAKEKQKKPLLVRHSPRKNPNIQ